jgi:hypothetical protein
MNLGRWEQLVRTVWGLLRGSLHYRFSALLVRIGAGLMLGQPVILVLLEKLFDVTFGKNDSWVDAVVALAPIVLGLALLMLGTILFLKRPLSSEISSSFILSLSGTETFSDAVRAALIGEKRGPLFEGFSPAEMNRKMSQGHLERDRVSMKRTRY